MKGVGIKKVQELMGHGSIGMTARYTHLEPAGQLEAVELLVGYGSKPRTPPVRKAQRARVSKEEMAQAAS